MDEIRAQWLQAITRYVRNPDRAHNERFWASGLDDASRDEVREIQSAKLRVAVRFAYQSIPFYRRKFDRIGLDPRQIRSVDDLALIPITTKYEMADDLAQHPPWGTYTSIDDQAWLDRGWQIFSTSGTTGDSRPFRYTYFDRQIWAWNDARALWAMGFRPGRDVALIAFGYGPHVWLWGVHYAFNLMGIPILTGGGMDTRTRARFIDQYKPTILCCTPSYALYLARTMTEMKIHPAATSVKFLFCAGEPGFGVPATRQRLETLWNAELHEFYGCTEAAPSPGGYTCSATARRKEGQVGVHLMEDAQIWETVDPATMAPVADGQRGLTVCTNLHSESSPQLRFLVGDYTVLSTDPCECGRKHMRAMGGFCGRADDMLNIRGVTLFPSVIEDAARRVPEIGDEFQIVVTNEHALDVLTVRVEIRPQAHPDASQSHHDRQGAIVQRLESEIISRCELRPVIQVEPWGTLPRTETKARRVKDLRNL